MTFTPYYGTKHIWAYPQTKDDQEGYNVRYEDGYTSWSPKVVFEAAYQPYSALSFGHALIALQEGKKVARSGWNGKGMFLYYVPAANYPAQTDVAKGYWANKGTGTHTTGVPLVPYGAYIAMKTAQDNVVPWLASQTDVLANDWQIVE